MAASVTGAWLDLDQPRHVNLPRAINQGGIGMNPRILVALDGSETFMDALKDLGRFGESAPTSVAR
jgi:hypothetical protein